MVEEYIEALPTWAISWQAALTPDPVMIPAENIFLLDSASASIANKVSLTATVGTIPGLLFRSPEALLYNICEMESKPTKKLARTRLTKSRKKSQRHSIATINVKHSE